MTTTADLAGPRADVTTRLECAGSWVRRHLPLSIGLTILVGFVFCAVFAPWIVPMEPNAQDTDRTFVDPFTSGSLLGTDNLGRDVASRLIAASTVALQAASIAVLVAMMVGIPLGLLAAFVGRWADTLVVRVTDALQSLPPLTLAIALLGAVGPGLTNAMVVIGMVFAPSFLRIVRATVLEILSETYVEASRSIGTPVMRLLLTRIVPNAAAPVLVQVSIVAGLALIAEASLSLLGLGVAPPDPSWGLMIAQGYNFVYQQHWLVVLPGLTLALLVLALNLVGDGLRDALGRGADDGTSR